MWNGALGPTISTRRIAFFNQKRFGKENARRPVESIERAGNENRTGGECQTDNDNESHVSPSEMTTAGVAF